MDKQLIYNAIQTPDGTILESRHTHDFICHTDNAPGKTYCVDGGLSYTRYVGDVLSDCKILTVYADDKHEIVREFLKWGTYGKNGDQPLTYIKLKDMTDEHIHAIIDNKHCVEWVCAIMKMELNYRLTN